MAAEDFLAKHPELRPFVLQNVRPTGVRIGAGAYGSVEEVAIPGAICAAKKIHDIFLDRTEIPAEEIARASARFVKECQLMSTLSHPNIVLFLGVCFCPGSRLPALVMERLLTCLHDLLDPGVDLPRPKPLFPLSLKCSILRDVGHGLAYLHEQSPPIIHRDLTARNVLLNSGMVAKIVDLGVARIMPRMTAPATMTKGPGASVYMPPEAVAPATSNSEKSKYDASIDIFSFGVITIFTIGETFPSDPLGPNYLDEQSGLLVPRTELQRRSEYMRDVNTQLRACGQLRADHPLIRLIQQCLQNGPRMRPSVRDVLNLLEEARAGAGDRDWEQVQVLQTKQQAESHAQKLQQELESKNKENAELQERLQNSEREKRTVTQRLQAELTRAGETIRRNQQDIQDMRQQRTDLEKAKGELADALEKLRQKERQLELSEASAAESQSSFQTRDSELEILKKKAAPKTVASTSTSLHYSESPPLKPGKLRVQCHPKVKAPARMLRGSATADNRFAYFTPHESRSVYRYEWKTGRWDETSPCPSLDSGLAVTDSGLISVGGEALYRTGKILTLRGQSWEEEYPPMNTARSSPAVVVTPRGDYVLVIGGYVGNERPAATVDMLQVKRRKWYRLTNLPHPLTAPSAAMCGDTLHVIGYEGKGYSCSLGALPSGDELISQLATQNLIFWTPLPDLPVTHSTAGTLCGQLVIFGGRKAALSVNTIHQLVDGQWVEIGSMISERDKCLVVNSSPDKVLVVSGVRAWNNVEECAVV